MNKWLLLIILSSSPAVWAAGQSPEPVARFAIVIGVNNDGGGSTAPGQRSVLRYADDDAVATHRLLTQAGVRSHLLVQLDKDSRRLHPTVTIDGPPTAGQIGAVLDHLISEIAAHRDRGQKTELYFFYSGHGDVNDGEGHVVLADGELTRTMLQDQIIARSPADFNHVIIDACKSYFLVFEKGPGGERSHYPFPFVPQPSAANQHKTGYILSSSSERDSHEWERFQAGVFSHEIRSALRGGADVNLDGRVTYGEIGAFVATANRGIVNSRFRPQTLIHPPGDPPGNYGQSLLDWITDQDILLVDAPELGHLYLEDQAGIRILDVHPTEEQRLRIHLPARRPVFIRDADSNLEADVTTGGTVMLSRLALKPARVTRKGALHLAFDKLFNTPFHARDVAIYEKERRRTYFLLANHQPPAEGQLTRETAKTLTLWTAVGAAAAGGALTLFAAGRHAAGKNDSNYDRDKNNKTIEKLNTSAVVCYTVAGVAAMSWLTLLLWPEDRPDALLIAPSATPFGLGLTVSGIFGTTD